MTAFVIVCMRWSATSSRLHWFSVEFITITDNRVADRTTFLINPGINKMLRRFANMR